MKRHLLIIFSILFLTAASQWYRSLSVGSNALDASSIFDITSTTKGSRPYPSMTEAQRDAIVSPATGLIVYNTDANSLNVYDGSAWGAVGSGGGSGAGGISFLEGDDADFEGNTVGNWVVYDDAAGSEPVSCATVGTPTVTFAANGTTPLRGEYDAVLTKDAADRQGEGVAVAFSIDNQDLNQATYVSFDLKTSANYEPDDVIPYIYDITAGQVIQLSRNGSSSRFTGRFNNGDTDKDYRLCLHVASTSALAYTVNVDNFRIGPEAIIDSPVVQNLDEIVTSPSVTGGAEITSVTNLRLQGSRSNGSYSLGVSFNYNSTSAGANGFDNLTIDLGDFSFLSGKTITRIDGSFDSNTNTAGGAKVSGYFNLSGTDSVQINFIGNFQTASSRVASGTINIYIEDEVGSSAIVSDKGLLNQVDRMAARETNGQSIPNSTSTTVIFNSVEENTGIDYDNSTGIITIKESGWIDVNATAAYSGLTVNVGDVLTWIVRDRGGVQTLYYGDRDDIDGTRFYVNANHKVPVLKGDEIFIRTFQSNGGSRNLTATNSTLTVGMEPNFNVYSAYGEPLKIQTKALQSNTATGFNGTLTDMTMNNLVVGRWYRVKFRFLAQVTAPNADNMVLTAFHDGNALDATTVAGQFTAGVAATGDMGFAEFQATATTVTFVTSSMGGASITRGNGTATETHATLSEINPRQITTDYN